ncbi:NAD-dependent epimerase/dehydratase family protein [Gracilimonas sp. Q87]|uniref:NAD-dependent epimerase/dehydratase family protein n=1 Tax=Gracilimonas sp. Q87 TaxID=3384766 RepID=UPI003983EB0F
MKSDDIGSVLIVGCGWVGKKLGHYLSGQGYEVYGTTRSKQNFSEIEDHSITPIKLQLPVDKIQNIELPKVDSVIISISPGRGENRDEYPLYIRQLAKLWEDSNTQVIMYSSTGVYGKSKGTITEEHTVPNEDSDNALCKAEGELRKILKESVILRLAGLYGEDRHPVKYLAGRKNISDGDAPVNLVHRKDVIRATELMIEERVRSQIYNICSPVHPSKSRIYTTIAKRLEMDKPEFLPGGNDNKQISPDKLVDNYDFLFMHPDPLDYRN